jgi:hypothetical protein
LRARPASLPLSAIGSREPRPSTATRCGRDASIGQVVAHAGGALDRQRIVDRVAAARVGMTDDPHGGGRVGDQRLREAVEHRAQVRLDVGAADTERHVARDLELQLVVRGLRDRDRGALRRLLHRALLILHPLGPQVAAAGAGGRADRGADPRALGAADHPAEHQPADRADAGAGRGAALCLAHVRAARHGRGRCDREPGGSV